MLSKDLKTLAHRSAQFGCKIQWNKNASRSGGTFGIARFGGMNNVDGWKEKLPKFLPNKGVL